MELYDEMIKQIVKARDNDSLILFIGAGISANSNLPTWSKLIEELKKDLGLSDNDNLDYLKIAQIYYDTFGQQAYLQKIEELFKIFPTPKPTNIHDLILKIAPKHIITTNYDSLMEQAARKKGLSYNVLAKDTDIPYVSSNRYIIKMHGDLQNKNIVLKESDYQDYEQNFPMISTLIKSLIMNSTILFIGYSLNDSTFNAIYRMISNSLASHARHSYFYTPEYQKDLLVTYYKNKGIHVISNGHIDDHSHLGENTESFLNDIINPNIPLEEKIWNKLKHLDKLAFID
ncbi:SIR2 family protein, partial [Enterococcus cecorum]